MFFFALFLKRLKPYRWEGLVLGDPPVLPTITSKFLPFFDCALHQPINIKELHDLFNLDY
jgi:hypothetical protein